MRRRPQLRLVVPADRPLDGYYNDLSGIALDHVEPSVALAELRRMTGDRETANPVSIVQLGLAAWQLQAAAGGWANVLEAAATWVVDAMDDGGAIAYHFPVGHTYELEPPWSSAMAQGEAASLLLRAAKTLSEPSLAAAAAHAAQPLLDPASALVALTDEGPVLQEYPTDPPAHVLNGWIFALWGLHDLASAGSEVAMDTRLRADAAFRAGCETLGRRLPLYRVWPRWSRYDLFPHRIAHVASPFYHRLHIEQLAVMSTLAPDPAVRQIAAEWERGARSPAGTAVAVSRKVAFRMLRPRHRLWPSLGRLE